MLGTKRTSIHALPPRETGGTVARHGFAVQDHVAASHCLDMIEDATLTQVWCENQDDVTLIWLNGSGEEIEFVQVKSNDLDQLWTIAKLAQKEAKEGEKEGKCILEKSLQYDSCDEPVRFRIVTSRPVKDELELLTFPLSHPKRAKTTAEFTSLLTDVVGRLADVKSDNGNGCEFWLERTFWHCIHSLESIHNKNLLRLMTLVEQQGEYLAVDHINELYQRLLRKVYEGGLAKWDRDAGKKKILRDDLIAWFVEAVRTAVHPGQLVAGKRLAEKLTEAGIPSDQFETIASMRLQYRLACLTPHYSELSKRKNIEGTITARLFSLRANLDGGMLSDDGTAFHARCLGVIDDVFSELPADSRPPIQTLYGFMYNLADRCAHRFVRAKP